MRAEYAAGMPSGTESVEQRARATVDDHVRLWNVQDRAGWIALFDDDCTFDDPVGAPTKHGREAIEKSWDSSHRAGRRWTLHPTRVIVCGNEVAMTLENHGVVDGMEMTVHGVEIWMVNDAGRVTAVRAYFEQPTVGALDPYFQVGPDG